MPTCAASYSEANITYGPGSPCSFKCEGATFKLDSMATKVNDQGACEFSWTVVRTITNPMGNTVSTKTFSDEATIGCPGTMKVTFYCDAAKTCAGYELTLTCASDTGSGGAGG